MFLAEYKAKVDRAVSGLLEELEADIDFFVQLAGWAAGVRREACGGEQLTVIGAAP